MLTEGASFTALAVRVRFLLGYLWKSYKYETYHHKGEISNSLLDKYGSVCLVIQKWDIYYRPTLSRPETIMPAILGMIDSSIMLAVILA